MPKISNPIYYEFKKLGLINDNNIVKISNNTRDKKIAVFQDIKSSIIFLEKYVTDENYYSSVDYGNKPNKKNTVKTKIKNKKTISSVAIDDDKRRSNQFRKIIKNKKVMDFGCGWGKFLENIKIDADKVVGVELRKECQNHINKNLKDIKVFMGLKETSEKFDVITSFHVLEHIPYQVEILKQLKKTLKEKGKLIIEVPHARDFLLSFDKLEEFKKFTFWSEHLVLHTEQSLSKVLRRAGFKKIKIIYEQRYGFTNHLGWAINRIPGGHEYFESMYDKKFNQSYKDHLKKRRCTDTIIAIAE